jgi:uroporphyrinogen-III synthase
VSCLGPELSDADLVHGTLVALAEAAVDAARDLEPRAPTVIVTRARDDGAATLLALVDRGFAPIVVPAIATSATDPDAADELVRQLGDTDWVVVTSARTVDALVAASRRTGSALATDGARWAAVGAATERALRGAGVTVAFRPESPTGASLAETLPVIAGETVWLPRGDLADQALPSRLAERGADVRSRVVYRTVEGPTSSRDAMRAALAGWPAAVLLASGSAVRGWLRLARDIDAEAAARSIPVIAIGPTTAAVARRHGLTVAAEAESPDPGSIADATSTAIRVPKETQ